MTEENTDGTEDQDKDSDSKDGSGPKMVLESDLLAVKNQRDEFKTKLTEAETKITTVETTAVDWQNKFNAAAAKSQTSTQELESLKTVQGDLDKLKEKSEGDSKLLTKANEDLVAKSKDLIFSRYPKLSKDKVDNKSQEQLDMMLDTLEDVAPSGQRTSDPGGGGGASNGTTPLEIAAAEMQAARGS